MADIRVGIVGAGFAGLSCALALSRVEGVKVQLWDKRRESQFLPLLPDLIGKDLSSAYLKYDLSNLAVRRIDFINKKVDAIDLARRRVICTGEETACDYLVLCAGSQTNFYGNDSMRRVARTLCDVDDALGILERLVQPALKNVVVVGGGYTGLEIAAAVKRYCDEHDLVRRIIVIEKGPSLLAGLDEFERDYAGRALKAMGIEVRFNAEVVLASPEVVSLKDGATFESVMLIWAAGVQAADLELKGDVLRLAQNRLKVDEFLQAAPGVFAAGDLAAVATKTGVLRMAVQFAVAEGRWCAANILRASRGVALRTYRPRDLGYIVPLGSERACGVALGVETKGFPALLLHYIMCLWRTFSWHNKWGIIKEVFLR